MSHTTQRRQALSRWAALLRRRLPPLSRPQAYGLALWSIGVVLAHASSLHAVTLALVCWLAFHPLNLRKRLQEWYLEAAAKKGHGSGGKGQHRRDWQPRTVCPQLLRWLLEDWPNRQLVVALDPTNFEDRFTVLAISVLYRRCAIPVMWTVLPGGQPGAWEPHWERMLGELAAWVPAGWQVLVLTDRGLYSPRLFACLVQQGWHPFFRIRAQGSYRFEGCRKWRDLKKLQPKNQQTQVGRAEVFKNDPGRLHCTLLAYRGEGYAEPWLVVTDVAPAVAQASWYGLRGWMEQGFKRVKSEGWKLPRTRITTCERLERVWLAVAVATLWVLEVGGAAEQEAEGERPVVEAQTRGAEDTPALPDLDAAPADETPTVAAAAAVPAGHLWSVFGRGWQLLRNALAVGVLLLGSWHPEPWPGAAGPGLPPTPVVNVPLAAVVDTQAPKPPDTYAIDLIHKCDSS